MPFIFSFKNFFDKVQCELNFGKVVGGSVGRGWVILLFRLLSGTGGNCEIEVARRGEQYIISFSFQITISAAGYKNMLGKKK